MASCPTTAQIVFLRFDLLCLFLLIATCLPGAARCLQALEHGAEGTIPCLRYAAAVRNLCKQKAGKPAPAGTAAYEGAWSQQPCDAGPDEWPHGWHFHATRI